MYGNYTIRPKLKIHFDYFKKIKKEYSIVFSWRKYIVFTNFVARLLIQKVLTYTKIHNSLIISVKVRLMVQKASLPRAVMLPICCFIF